jgi:hypothetical protein
MVENIKNLLIQVKGKLSKCPTGQHDISITNLQHLINISVGRKESFLVTCKNHWRLACVAEHDIDLLRKRDHEKVQEDLELKSRSYCIQNEHTEVLILYDLLEIHLILNFSDN